MKRLIGCLFFILAHFLSFGQCASVAVQVSSSDTTYVQLYHAGFFIIPSGFDNICEWEVTSFSGDVLFQETTSGAFVEQSSVIFDHSIPITDSMKVTLLITNNTEGITCTMNDTLYWKATEVFPNIFIGNWDVLSSNGGVKEDISTATKLIQSVPDIKIYPSPVNDHFMVRGDSDLYSFAILDLNGQVLALHIDVLKLEKVDVSHFSAGVYFVQFWDAKKRSLGVKKMIKM